MKMHHEEIPVGFFFNRYLSPGRLNESKVYQLQINNSWIWPANQIHQVSFYEYRNFNTEGIFIYPPLQNSISFVEYLVGFIMEERFI